MPVDTQLTEDQLTEEQLTEESSRQLQSKLQQIAVQGQFAGINNIALDWVCYHPPGATEVILLINGRIESHYKYWESIHQLTDLGYAVFSYDHRGQGASGRLTRNPHKGHVELFEHYLQDLNGLCQQQLWPRQYQQVHLLCHSMGSCVGARFLARYQPRCSSAVFCSPMFKIHSGKIPEPLAKQLVRGWSWASRKWCQFFGGEPGYFLFGSDYKDKPFADNHLTHSESRYQLFRNLYRQQPKLQLGSPTAHWVEQAIESSEAAIAEACNITIPLLVITAGDDQVVDNQGAEAFCQNAANCRLINIDGARHELLFEADSYRTPTVKAVLEFVGQQRQVSEKSYD
jgi:lysophospholipase